MEIIPQHTYTYGDGVPAYKSGEWPGSKSSRFFGSKLILKPIQIPYKDFYICNSRHFPPKYSDEFVFKKGLKSIPPFIHDDVYRPKKRPLEPIKTEQKIYIRNRSFRPKDNLINYFNPYAKEYPFLQKKQRVKHLGQTLTEYYVEDTMNRKKRIFSLGEQRNYMKNLKSAFGYLLLIIIAISMLYPFWAMLNLSFVPNSEIFNQNGKILYSPVSIDNYVSVFQKIPLWKYFMNSLFVACFTTLGQIIFASLAGYAFARLNFKYRDSIFLIVLITMLAPPQVNIIPLFFLMRQLHWVNTYQALIVPGLFGGFGIFMMRQYFMGLPKDLEESARIDGCNIFDSFFRIILPLSVPIIATLSIFTFVTTWNSFMWPLIVTNSDALRTLPLGLSEFKGSFREITDWGALTAFSAICSMPVIIVFLAGRKYFINDIMNGGVKE